MNTNERRERRRRPEMKQIVEKSNVPSATEAEGKRKVEFKYGSVNEELELKSEGDDNIVEAGIKGKDEGIESEPLATKKGDFLIDMFVVLMLAVVVDDSPATVPVRVVIGR